MWSTHRTQQRTSVRGSTLSMDKQINSICQSAFYHLRNIAQINEHISFLHCETLIHAFVTSKIDHYNILLSGLKQDQLWKLQYVQNSAARLLTGTRKHKHITPVLRDLHWLPVHERIRFKILLMTFKCLNQLAPSYLSDLLIHYRLSRTLRSSDKELLVQPRCHLKTYGERAFSFIAPKLWNTKLWSAGDNDRRSKRFCFINPLCVSFTWQIVKTCVIRLRVTEGPHVRSVYSIHS